MKNSKNHVRNFITMFVPLSFSISVVTRSEKIICIIGARMLSSYSFTLFRKLLMCVSMAVHVVVCTFQQYFLSNQTKGYLLCDWTNDSSIKYVMYRSICFIIAPIVVVPRTSCTGTPVGLFNSSNSVCAQGHYM